VFLCLRQRLRRHLSVRPSVLSSRTTLLLAGIFQKLSFYETCVSISLVPNGNWLTFEFHQRNSPDRVYVGLVALLVARRINDRKVAGSRPIKVVCITVLTGNRVGWTARCGRPPLLLPSCRKLEFRQSALIDSDLAWVNGKSGRQSWRYANAFQRSIISEAIYHFTFT